MKDKIIIWGFPGVGKSSIADGQKILDLDSEFIKYHMFDAVIPAQLQARYKEILDLPYPENLILFVKASVAEAVLLNCHTSLLKNFENVYLVYPSKELKEIFLSRYENRGTDASYIVYMREAYGEIIASLSDLPYPRYILTKENQFLGDIIRNEKGALDMSRFMTKKELVELIHDAFRLDVFPDKEYLESHPGITAEEIAVDLFDGNFSFNIEALIESVQI